MFRFRTRFAFVAIAALVSTLGSTSKANFVATAMLNGGNQRPTPNASPAIGSAMITYETAQDDLLYTVTFSGLMAPATAAHIHIGGSNATGPVVLPFTNQGPPSATSGTFSGTLTNADIVNSGTSGLTDISQIAAQIFAGNAYINIHDSAFPSGEIRGQWVVAEANNAPEPSSIALISVALVGSGIYGLQRKISSRLSNR